MLPFKSLLAKLLKHSLRMINAVVVMDIRSQNFNPFELLLHFFKTISESFNIYLVAAKLLFI